MNKNLSDTIKFKNDKEKLNFIADTIQLDALEQFSFIMERNELTKADVAKSLGVSTSFISQLFAGDKKLNLQHLAAIIFYFNVKLNISIKEREKDKIIQFSDYVFKNSPSEKKGFCESNSQRKPYKIEIENDVEEQVNVL